MIEPRPLRRSSQRQRRVAEMLRQLVSEILLQRQLKNETLNQIPITITDAQIGADLQNAVFFFNCPATVEKETALKALKDATAEIRKGIASQIQLRYVPQLYFRYDNTLENAGKIDALFNTPRVLRDTQEPQ